MIIGSTSQARAVRAEGRSPLSNPRIKAQDRERFSCLGIPQPQGPIVCAGYQLRVIRSKRGIGHAAPMLQDRQGMPCGAVPEAGGWVPTGGDESRAVVTEHEISDLILMPAQGGHLSARGGIPEPHRAFGRIAA